MSGWYAHPADGFDHADAEVERNGVIVTLEWIGEGWDGEYDQDDLDDCPLLRFSVYRRDPNSPNGRLELDDASYRTQIPATVRPEIATALATYILDQVFDSASSGHSMKKLCERLSWIGPSWLDPANSTRDTVLQPLVPGSTE